MMNLRKFTGLLSLLLIVSACGDAVEISIEMDDDANSTQSAAQQQDGWTMLFDGKTLHGWNVQNTDTWLVEDGVLTVKAKGDIWTQQQYGNFVFECDFKISPECNSGIFIRTGDTENEVQTGM